MSINKKYTPKPELLTRQSAPVDGYFPLFSSSYHLPSHQERERFYYLQMMTKNIQHFTGKNYQPFQIQNWKSSDYLEHLQGKEKLPLFAKMQRLEQIAHKQTKKNNQTLEAFWQGNQIKKLTLDAEILKQLQSLISSFQQKGLITYTPELIYRDTDLQTPVHQDEIERREEQKPLLEIRCFVETKSEVFNLIVDDLMLFFSDVAVFVHKNDKRYKKFIGKNILLPFINKAIPIIATEDIDTVKNNGIQRVNPLLSPEDFEKVKEL